MSVKWKSRDKYSVAVTEDRADLEDDGATPEVYIDGSLTLCTPDEAVQRLGFGVFQLLLLTLGGLAWSAVSMEILLMMILSPILKLEWNLTALQEATLTAVLFSGYFIGYIFWNVFSDLYGRKWCLFFSLLLTSCFGLMAAGAPSFEIMNLLRFLTGFSAAGGKQGIALAGEYCPTKYRRTGVQMLEVFWVVGSVGIVGTGWAVVPTLGWRWLVGFAAVPVILMTFIVPLMPPSPWFLVVRGKREQALKVFNLAARINCKPKVFLQLQLVTEERREQETARDDQFKEKLTQSIVNDSDNMSAEFSGDLVITQQKPPVQYKIQMLQFLSVWRNGKGKSTFLLWLVWPCTVAYYYGIILLTTALFQYDKHCGCLADVSPDIYKTLEYDDYLALLWTSLADVPGIVVAVALLGVPCLGRKLVMACEFGLLAMATGLLLICVDRIYLTIVLFVCRATIACAYQTVQLYTSELYSPAGGGGVGLDLCVLAGQLGGILAPFVAQTLLAGSDYAGILVFVFFASFGGIFSGILPQETRATDFKMASCSY